MKTKCRLVYRFFRGWEPQMQYNVGWNKNGKMLRWFPLNQHGYWLEPDAFSYGKITKHNYFSKAVAKRTTSPEQQSRRENDF